MQASPVRSSLLVPIVVKLFMGCAYDQGLPPATDSSDADATSWCAHQAKPAGVADTDYRCVDFDDGLPASSQWTQQKRGEGSLALTSARAKSATNSMHCIVTAEDDPNSDEALLSWTTVGADPVKSARLSFDLSPTAVQELREWSGDVELACLRNATAEFCLKYIAGTELNGYFLHVAYNAGLPIFNECRISASIGGNVWTNIELSVSDSVAPVVKINGSEVSTPDCDLYVLNADTNLTVTAGLAVTPFTYDAFTAYYDDVVAHVQR